MSNVGRRLFSALIASAPAAVSSTKADATPPTVPQPMSDFDFEFGSHKPSPLQDAIYKALQPHNDREHREEERLSDMRGLFGGSYLDPDLASLRSVSRVNKAHIQMARDRARKDRHSSIKATIIRALGGDPKEWE